ncbi:hypothetical protein [Kitasatospora sp. NPDC050543]|uniref:hypothetical protein n=1 Tax=Kitasatospora sp. NPDC050543 TaxID=3364054 RepID=UPI00379081E0
MCLEQGPEVGRRAQAAAPCDSLTLQQLIDNGARLKLELREIRHVDDVALVSNTATLTGVDPEPVISTTTEILRRQPDGGWVHVVDDPFFS